MMQSTACVEGECWDCPEDIGACTCECHLCPTCDEPSEDEGRRALGDEG